MRQELIDKRSFLACIKRTGQYTGTDKAKPLYELVRHFVPSSVDFRHYLALCMLSECPVDTKSLEIFLNNT